MDPFDASLDLLRRLDPKDVGRNVTALCKIAPSLAEDLLSSVDQPLEIKTCSKSGKKFLACDYNRDGDSYRSPWSGTYEPALSDGPEPSPSLRKLEVLANDSFDVYRDLYYEGGISSVYLWDQDDGFAGVALFKKSSNKASESGDWDSIHVFEVETGGRRSATYRVTSTVILDIKDKSDKLGGLGVSGNLTRQTERVLSVEDEASHIANVGTLVEEIESKMRNMLNEVYFGKTRDIVGDLRSKWLYIALTRTNSGITKLTEVREERALQSEVAKGLGA